MKFGQYELLARIAVGGMAEVYEGRAMGAEGFEKHVAIKRILPDLAEDERFVKMLLTEARIHSALSHRNIVQIHDLGISEDGEYFIVLEYVEGYDLRVIQEQMGEGGEILPEALSLHIAAEVAQGLHFAHELHGADGQALGLVHRDVSPSNVLISMAGEVKLSDFGLAKRRHDRSFIGSLKGNLAYMSPEQARQATLDRKTDIFSLGAVLFELLTGRRIREITDEVSVWNQVASGVVPPVRELRPDLPESFERVLNQALAVDPEKRFPDAATFGTAIRELLALMNIPVGASDLQALVGMLSPARRPRSLLERSKVIRLGPEAEALSEVITAPSTPPPLVTGPPPATTPTAPPAVISKTPPRVVAPVIPEAPAPAPTPPPAPPLPPARVRQPTPASPGPVARPERGPLPLARSPRESGPFPAIHSGLQGNGAMAPVVPVHSRGGARQSASMHAVAAPSPEPSAQPHWHGATALAVAQPLPQPRHVSEPSLAALPPTGLWRLVAVALSAVVILAASVVHLAVIPLEVLFTWSRPTALYVASEPEGAAVKVDGVPMADPAPAKIEVRRDRAEHMIEVTAPGYQSGHETVRYDRSMVLSFVIRLQKDSGVAPPAPAPAPVPPHPTAK